MYSQISSNKRKTFLLISIFVGIILGLGYVLGQTSGYGNEGILIAVGISFLMTLISYYGGDKLALATSGAKKIEKTDNPYLWRIVENLSIAAGLPMPKLHIINDGAINAFATGRDPSHASVAVTTGAIEKLENEELEGVLAHELSHVKNYDIRVMTIVIVLVGTIALLSDWMFRAHFLMGRRDRDRGAHPIFLLIGLLLAILTPLIAQLIQLAVSRRREYLADASGALLTRFPEGLARALEKINLEKKPLTRANTATAHLFISNPFGASRLRTLFSTHPPIEERIKTLRQMA
ncbi:M48 family metalloprotease [Candidatus Uhrbacteria bacterium]|nr:M48 family metalloprotease [Candidatus Uhrbacteria bacterium]